MKIENKTNSNTYKNHDSQVKQFTRELLIKESLNNIGVNRKSDTYNVFSLPSSNFKFENSLNSFLNRMKVKSQFDLIERDKTTYDKGIKNISRSLNSNFINQDLNDFKFNSSKKYDFVWFDLCSKLSVSTIDLINNATFNLTIRREGYFCITLTKSRENTEELKKFFNTKSNVKIETIRDKYLVDYIQDLLNVNLLSIVDYQDSYYSRSTPMRLMIFKNDKVESPYKLKLNKNKI